MNIKEIPYNNLRPAQSEFYYQVNQSREMVFAPIKIIHILARQPVFTAALSP